MDWELLGMNWCVHVSVCMHICLCMWKCSICLKGGLITGRQWMALGLGNAGHKVVLSLYAKRKTKQTLQLAL